MVAASKQVVAASSTSGVRLSQAAELALKGGHYDARKFLPKPRSVNDSAQDEEALRLWRTKLRIVDGMNVYGEDIAKKLLDYMEETILGFKSPAGKRDKTSEYFNETYVWVKKLPKYWRAEFLAKRFGQSVGLTEEKLNQLDLVNSDTINYIFDYVCGVHGQTHLPRPCLNKAVCEEVFFRRAKELNRATQEWFKAALTTENVIDWTNHGVYRFEKTENNQHVLRHCDGASVPWRNIVDGAGGIKIEGNCWDRSAKLVFDRQDLKLHKYFNNSEGPNREAVVNLKGEVLDQLALAVEKETGAKRRKNVDYEPVKVVGQDEPKQTLAETLDDNQRAKRRRIAQKKAAENPLKPHRTLVGALAL